MTRGEPVLGRDLPRLPRKVPGYPAGREEGHLPGQQERGLGMGLEAHEPPEARGVGRDGVRMLVAERSTGRTSHHRFTDLPALLRPGDVLVVNTSATLPAAVPI